MFEQASRSDFPHIVSLLKDVRFPNLPEDGSAEVILETAHNYLLKRDGEMIGWVAIHNVSNNTAMLDIAVKTEWRGKWLTKGLIRELGKCIFTYMGVQYLYVECFNGDGAKLAHRLGFKHR